MNTAVLGVGVSFRGGFSIWEEVSEVPQWAPVGELEDSPPAAGDLLQIILQWCTLKESKTIFC